MGIDKSKIKLATRKQRITFKGEKYHPFIVDEKLFLLASEVNRVLNIGNVYQYIDGHTHDGEMCYVRGIDGSLHLKKAVSESALRRFARDRKVSDLINLIETMRASYSMPIARSTEDDLSESIKPIVAQTSHVDVAKNKKADQLERVVAAGLNHIKTHYLQEEITGLKKELAEQKRINKALSKFVPKPTGYSALLERAHKWNTTAKTTTQVAADYGYSLEDFQEKLIEFDIVQGAPVIARVTALPDDNHLFIAGYLKKYPKIAIEPLWTIAGQEMIYTALGARNVVPLIDKLNDIETGYNISI